MAHLRRNVNERTGQPRRDQLSGDGLRDEECRSQIERKDVIVIGLRNVQKRSGPICPCIIDDDVEWVQLFMKVSLLTACVFGV